MSAEKVDNARPGLKDRGRDALDKLGRRTRVGDLGFGLGRGPVRRKRVLARMGSAPWPAGAFVRNFYGDDGRWC